jgi:hypothetical protein
VNRRIVLVIILLVCYSVPAICWGKTENDKIVFELTSTDSPHIYAVGFRYNGEARRYVLFTIPLVVDEPRKGGKLTVIHTEVWYDEISKNFYALSKNGVLTIVPINRPYELKKVKR